MAAERSSDESSINLEERPGKTVGRISGRPPGEFLERLAEQLRALGVELPYPRGVFRFKTFEEADEWAMQHRIAAAVRRLREHQR